MSFSEVETDLEREKGYGVEFFSVSLGWLRLIYNDNFLCRVEFVENLGERKKSGKTTLLKAPLPDWLVELKKALKAYFEGEKVAFSAPLGLSSLPLFYQLVYLKAQEIPYGETRSYQWVATQVGNPKAARAVGQALKNNPFLVVVPCHRVIRSDGSLGGWSGPEGLKEKLLKLEGARVGKIRQNLEEKRV